MKHLAIVLALVMAGICAPASAQLPPQAGTPVPPVPPPPAPPPPSLDIPKVPNMDAPSQPSTKAPSRRSFNDRINDCLTDTNAARLNTSERAAYSRGCANQQ